MWIFHQDNKLDFCLHGHKHPDRHFPLRIIFMLLGECLRNFEMNNLCSVERNCWNDEVCFKPAVRLMHGMWEGWKSQTTLLLGCMINYKEETVMLKLLRVHCTKFKRNTLFFSSLLFTSPLSSRQADRFQSLYSVCSNKEETGRAWSQLISLAQILVVNGKC